MEGPASFRSARSLPERSSLHGEDSENERNDQPASNEIFNDSRRKDEHVTGILDQGSKAGDAEWHEEEPKSLPTLQAGGAGARRSGADEKRKAYYGAQTNRSEPEAR